MRVIAKSTLTQYLQNNKYTNAGQALKSWYLEAEKAVWKSPSELKAQFATASVITDKRVVFNIKGNDYRLVTDIEYRLQIIFIVWFGTHKEYDKVDVKVLHFRR